MFDSLYVLTAVLAALAFATLLAPRLHLPQPLALAFAGVGLTFLPDVRASVDHLDPKLVLVGFLPPLLYADAWNTSWRDFHRWLRPILMLAVGLVALTILVVGVVAKLCLPGLPPAVCFVLGAIVSPTDTVAVQSVLERLRVPRRATAILGGESLVNDATGLVGVHVGVVVVLNGAFELGGVLGHFLWIAGLGVLIGVAVGLLFALANRIVRDVPVLFTLSLLSPYFAFALASSLSASGVLAVVAAGAVVAWRLHQMPVQGRVQLRATWTQLTFVLNGLCFLYIGLRSPMLLEATLGRDRQLWTAGLLVSLAVIGTRFLWVWPAAYLPLWLAPKWRAREGGYPPPAGVVLASWCGVRGAVSLAAALALPERLDADTPFPGRNEVIACTVAVILVTLFLQGGTLLPLVRLLGLQDDGTTEQEMRQARERILEAGIARLDLFCSENECPVAVHRYRESMAEELASLRADDDAERKRARQRLAVSQEVRLAVAVAQEAALLLLRDRAVIDDHAYNHLLLELDLAIVGAEGVSD